MPRIGTPNLNLGTYLDGEYPGAGSQSVDSDGLNGTMIKVDRAVGTEHNADGSHKANVIKGSNLVQSGANSTVDGATLEFNANKIRVKANGLNGTHLNQTAGQTVDNSTLEFNSNAIRVKTGGIAAAQLATDAVETAKIKNANVTTEKFEYQELIFMISQSGVADPSVTVIKNTTSALNTLQRTGTGTYVLSDGAGGHIFTTGKTSAAISGVDGGIAFLTFGTDVSIQINTKNHSNTAIDSLLSNTMLFVRVYP